MKIAILNTVKFSVVWLHRQLRMRRSLKIICAMVFAMIACAVFFVDTIPPRIVTVGRIETIRFAIARYHREHRLGPMSLAMLPAIDGHPLEINDAWGRPILVTQPSDRVMTLTSFGADGRPGGSGTAADIFGTFDPSADARDAWIVDPRGRARVAASRPCTEKLPRVGE